MRVCIHRLSASATWVKTSADIENSCGSASADGYIHNLHISGGDGKSNVGTGTDMTKGLCSHNCCSYVKHTLVIQTVSTVRIINVIAFYKNRSCCVCLMAEEPHSVEASDEIGTSSDTKAKILMKITISRSKTSKKKRKRKARALGKKSKSLEPAGENKSVSVAGKKKKRSATNFPDRSESTNSTVSENGPSTPSDSYKTKLPGVLVARPKRPRKQYLCSQCGRQMKSKSSLDIHIRTHTGDRPFMCPILSLIHI